MNNIISQAKKYNSFYIFAFVLLGLAVIIVPNSEGIGNYLFIGAAIFSTIASFIYIKGKNVICCSTVVQMFIIYCLLTCFWMLMIKECYLQGTIMRYKLAYIIAVCLHTCLFVWLYKLLPYTKNIISTVKQYLISNKVFIAIIFLFIICYLPCFNYLFKSDSNVYFNSIVQGMGKWNFSLADLSSFEMGYHRTYGYSLFTYIGYALIPNSTVGIRLVNLIIYLVTIFMAYEIFKKISNSVSQKMALIGVIVFAFSPVILGISQELNTDMPMTCFFVWLFFAGIFGYNVLFVFSTILLCFSKEIGIILVAGYLLGVNLYRLFENPPKHFNIHELFKNVKYIEWFSLVGPVLFIIFTFFNGELWGTKTEAIQRQKGLVNSVQVDSYYIVIKLKEIFVLNFQWLLVLGIIGMSIYCIKKHLLKVNASLLGIIVTSGAFILFNLFYFTYPHSRYLQLNAFFYAYYYIYLLSLFDTKKIIIYIYTYITIFLQFIQVFVQTDFLSNLLFDTVSTGNGRIISLAYYNDTPDSPYILVNKKEGADLSSEVFRDYVQINRSYERFEELFEKILTDIDYSENDAIYLSPIYKNAFWGDLNYTLGNMFGTYDRYLIKWNSSKNKLTYNNKDIKINWLDDASEENIANYDEVWYIYLPFENSGTAETYMDLSQVDLQKEYIYCEWRILLYKIK